MASLRSRLAAGDRLTISGVVRFNAARALTRPPRPVGADPLISTPAEGGPRCRPRFTDVTLRTGSVLSLSHRTPPEQCVACSTLTPTGLVLMSDGRDYCETSVRNVGELFNYRPVAQRTDSIVPEERGTTAAWQLDTAVRHRVPTYGRKSLVLTGMSSSRVRLRGAARAHRLTEC